MILSQTAIYALQAVMHLAEAGPGEPHRVGDIAEALGVPRNYLAKILNGLARSGVLTSTRGPGGGFLLAQDPSGLCLADVIQPFGDVAHESSCLLGRARCSDIAPCAAHARWKVVSTAVKGYLLETTIQDMTASCGAVPKPVGPTP
ncbi:MAG TPA: Rrf2 family transcriptional regulator [Longimicrobiales bacterium]|nr:Rrf2 family transcriptional regulator [Longimicrobiales bacterium]